MNKTICFVAGKSGGHILPAIYLAKKAIDEDQAKKILFFTNNSLLDKDLLKKYSYIEIQKQLTISSLSKKSLNSFIRFSLTFIHSFFVSLITLHKIKPYKIVTTGGAVALPVCLAGYLLQIPLELIELNAIPGKTITFLSRFATTISICFEQTKNYFPQASRIQYPIRFTESSKIDSEKARRLLHLDPTKTTLFILGGSQGSLFINNLIKKMVESSRFPFDAIQLIHQIGSLDLFDWKGFYEKHGIKNLIFSFYDRLDYCYCASDLIICRSGAGTLFEIDFFNKNCITIPLQTDYTQHQVDNAQAFKDAKKNSITILYQHHLATTEPFEKALAENLIIRNNS